MSNHKEVQTQQLASMTIGAKPLLGQLRDIIEWDSECSQLGDEEYERCIIEHRDNAILEGWYDRGFIRDGSARLEKEQARRINDILSLYEDRPEREEELTANATSDVGAEISEVRSRLARSTTPTDLAELSRQTWLNEVRLLRDAARREPSLRRYELLTESAKRISLRTDPRALARVIVGEVGPPKLRYDLGALFQSFSKKVQSLIPDDIEFWRAHVDWGPDEDSVARSMIAEGLVAAPADGSRVLLSIDEWLRENVPGSTGLAVVEADREGLVAAVSDQETVSKNVEALKFDTEWADGRLSVGIVKLIEEYFRAEFTHAECAASHQLENCESKSMIIDSARRTMMLDLSRFAEKVLTVANNDVLLTLRDQDRQGGPVSRFGRERLDRYVLVLQAIGNAILVQADELLQRDAHEKKIRREILTEIEIGALKKLFDPDALANLKCPDRREDADPASDIAGCRDLNFELDFAGIEDKTENDLSTQDVLDILIAGLRYALVRAELSGDARQIAEAKEALRRANEHRSGMIYIRPPGAYLRSSFAASGLQSDPRLRWESMLRGQLARSIPFFGELLVNESEERRVKTLTEIDKQFWQNINSVRLAGAGITNYVLVKDDIGNWYAKGFSADPKPIFEGAQSLALYNLGGSLNANLLRQRNLERELSGTTDATRRAQIKSDLDEVKAENRGNATGRGAAPTLGQVLAENGEEYVEATEAAYGEMRQELGEDSWVLDARASLQAQAAAGVTEELALTGDPSPASDQALTPRRDLEAALSGHFAAAWPSYTGIGETFSAADCGIPSRAEDDARRDSDRARRRQARACGERIAQALSALLAYRGNALARIGDFDARSVSGAGDRHTQSVITVQSLGAELERIDAQLGVLEARRAVSREKVTALHDAFERAETQLDDPTKNALQENVDAARGEVDAIDGEIARQGEARNAVDSRRKDVALDEARLKGLLDQLDLAKLRIIQGMTREFDGRIVSFLERRREAVARLDRAAKRVSGIMAAP